MWKNFQQLTSWEKLGVLGALASLIGIPLAFYLSSSPSPSDTNTLTISGANNTGTQIVNNGTDNTNSVTINQIDTKKQSQIETAKNLIDDFRQIMVLLPPHRVISDCLKRHNREKFVDAFEICDSESKINHTHALDLIERNITKIKFSFPNDMVNNLMQDMEKIRFYAYEMHNNTLTREHWRSDGCSDTIAFFDELSNAPVNKKGEPNCTLSFEGYDSFIDRQPTSGHHPYKSIISSHIPKPHLSGYKFIIQAKNTKTTIDDFFENMNVKLYESMVHHINELTYKLRTYTQ